MNGWILTGILCIFFVLFILFIRIRIKIHYLDHGDHRSLYLRVWVCGLPVYKMNTPAIAFDEDSLSFLVKKKRKITHRSAKKKDNKLTAEKYIAKLRKFHIFIERSGRLRRVARKFFRHVTVKEFRWHTQIGLGNAAWTGMAVGIVWGIKGSIVAWVTRYMKFEDSPDLSIQPHYQKVCTKMETSCMISFRVGHAMGAVFFFMK